MTDSTTATSSMRFQFAYALGLLVAGRFVDKVGTRIGYMVIMAIWSLSAMGHALANTVLQFGIARACLGHWRIRQLPGGYQDRRPSGFRRASARWPRASSTRGANVGAILAPLIVPWVTIHYGWHAAFLVTGIFSATWILLWFLKYHKPAEHPTLTAAELNYINQGITEQPGPSTPWIKLLGYRQTWAFTIGKFLTDPIWWFYLFWLPSYFTPEFQSRSLAIWACR